MMRTIAVQTATVINDFCDISALLLYGEALIFHLLRVERSEPRVEHKKLTRGSSTSGLREHLQTRGRRHPWVLYWFAAWFANTSFLYVSVFYRYFLNVDACTVRTAPNNSADGSRNAFGYAAAGHDRYAIHGYTSDGFISPRA